MRFDGLQALIDRRFRARFGYQGSTGSNRIQVEISEAGVLSPRSVDSEIKRSVIARRNIFVVTRGT